MEDEESVLSLMAKFKKLYKKLKQHKCQMNTSETKFDHWQERVPPQDHVALETQLWGLNDHQTFGVFIFFWYSSFII